MYKIILLLLAFTFLSQLQAVGQQKRYKQRKPTSFNQQKIQKRVKKWRGNSGGFNMDIAHTLGTKGFDGNLLIGEKTKAVAFNYQQFLRNKIGIKLGLGYEFGNPYSTSYEGYYVEVQPVFNVLNVRQKVFLNLQGGLSIVHDNYQRIETLDSRLNYGAVVGIDAELLLRKRVAVVSQIIQKYINGDGRWFWGAGLRYVIY